MTIKILNLEFRHSTEWRSPVCCGGDQSPTRNHCSYAYKMEENSVRNLCLYLLLQCNDDVCTRWWPRSPSYLMNTNTLGSWNEDLSHQNAKVNIKALPIFLIACNFFVTAIYYIIILSTLKATLMFLYNYYLLIILNLSCSFYWSWFFFLKLGIYEFALFF